ncbi:MAG: aminotransferase class I/II-fold pyridoxal phosphate-dependent enzyme [Verrucomicrobiota bacterium]
MTEPETLQPVDRTYVHYHGRKLSYFSGCDYFRLASHPEVIQAAQQGLKQFGLSVSASRLTTGNHPLYQTLENELARFFAVEAALLLPTGYLSSHAVAQALAGKFSHVLIDERAHPALQDAALLLDCPILNFKHRDPSDFAGTVARCGAQARMVVLTDGLFAHNSSVAPLKAYLKILPRDGLIVVDDAHGAGVLGKTGKGTIELEGVSRSRVIQCLTLSKAFGAHGGAVLGSRALRQRILDRSRMFIGSTPMALPLASAALEAVKLLRSDRSFRRRLFANVAYVKTALRKAGYALPEIDSPMIPIELESKKQITDLKRKLLAAGIYPPFLNYPGSPANGYFRFIVSSEHRREQLDSLIAILKPQRQS